MRNVVSRRRKKLGMIQGRAYFIDLEAPFILRYKRSLSMGISLSTVMRYV